MFITLLLLFNLLTIVVELQRFQQIIIYLRQMTKSLRQVQQKIKYLKQQIHDVIELASLNNQSIICLSSNNNSNVNDINNTKSIIFNQHTLFQQQIKSINQLLQKRTQNHLNYLIIRQIQGQQQSVRRDRLNQYQDKIYDQRRIISDKQVFLQNLYRPKKQRPDYMSSQKFQQLRHQQRAQQQKIKQNSLTDQIRKLTQFHQMLSRIKIISLEANNSKNNGRQQQQKQNNNHPQQHLEIVNIRKGIDLQRTKAHSLETVNLSTFNNLQGEKQEGIVEQTQLNNIRQSYANHTNSNNIQQHQSTITSSIANINTLPIKSNNIAYKLQPLQNNHKYLSLSQNGKQLKPPDACYSIPISKLINGCEKELKKLQGRERLDRIKELLRKISKKKQQNGVKMKQLREMEIENAHMHEYLVKVKRRYLTEYAQLKNHITLTQNAQQS